MKERKYQKFMLAMLLTSIVCAGLYAWGGMEHKWLRRYLAPIIFCLTAGIISRDWRYAVQAPLMMLSLSMGYGADVFWHKVGRRALFGLAAGTASGTVMYWRRLWIPAVFNHILLIAAYITFGVWNPLPARAEETLLGALVFLIPAVAVKPKQREE